MVRWSVRSLAMPIEYLIVQYRISQTPATPTGGVLPRRVGPPAGIRRSALPRVALWLLVLAVAPRRTRSRSYGRCADAGAGDETGELAYPLT